MSELKPCPFCGGEADIGHINLSPQSDTAILNKTTVLYFVNCINEKLTGCGANNGGPSVGHLSKESAIKAWNNRTIEKELLEALKEIVPELRGMATISPVAEKLLCKADKAINRARGKQP